jgi:hypothetical protein
VTGRMVVVPAAGGGWKVLRADGRQHGDPVVVGSPEAARRIALPHNVAEYEGRRVRFGPLPGAEWSR